MIVTAATLVVTGLPATAATPGDPIAAWRDVVVTGSSAAGAADAVRAAGGRVLTSLPVVRGVAAKLPPGAALGPRWLVAAQRALHLTGAPAEPTSTTVSTVRATLGLAAGGDEGRGVTVAVVDTGIADVPDLAGRVAGRVDVTGTGGGDGFGHGTFMAGLIAASGAASGGAYRGVAPAAKLLDVKVADDQGRTDLITVLRGLQWVSERPERVQVLNLSLSSYSPLPYQLDPLTQALEALWRRGVTVVVPSGNDGDGGGTVTSPGSDPVLLTVGGLDESGTGGRGDDAVSAWSGRGPSWQGDAKPDLVAPGAHLLSLRAPGSVVDVTNPQARVGTGYFRGSGTSMATAVTSGVVAAVLAERPTLRPNAVKDLVTGTAYAGAGLGAAAGAGAGGLDARRAVASAQTWRTSSAANQAGQDAAVLVRDAKRWLAFEKALFAGDRPAAAKAWRELSPASREWAARTWSQLDPATREWAGRAWAGRAWASGADGTAQEWAGRAWAGRAWAGRAWADAEWTGRAWADAEWTGRAWAGRAWADAEWTGRAWAGRAWADAEWTGRAWADAEWTGRAWADAEWTGRAWCTGTWSGRAWAWLSR